MAKNAVTHKRNVGGLEAPRNSLEMPTETSYSIYSGRDNILYAYHVNKDSLEKCCSAESPINKQITKEITKQSVPSVVARLMGVDTLPFDSKQSPQLAEMKAKNHVNKSGRSKKGSAAQDPSFLNSFGLNTYSCSDQYTSYMKSNKPKAREHPQEEELRKFKNEFEAWQAVRFKECSKASELDCAPSQLIAQEDLFREKMFLYVKSKDGLTSRNGKNKNEHTLNEEKVSFFSNRSSITGCRASQVTEYDWEPNSISDPPKIVILRPGPARMGINENSWNSTPSSSEERGNIKDFLAEVKERLKSEIQGKSCSQAAIVREGGIETPFWEKPSEPRQIAQRIAQQVKNSVTGEILGMNLLRSESTKSYQSDVHLDGIDPPEFINKDTRRFLTEKLRNVLKSETQREISLVTQCSRGLLNCDYKNGRAKNNVFGLEKEKRSLESVSDEVQISHKESCPNNLIRSLSAPVSGTSFGKLLLEDRHMVTGAHIRRQHEVGKVLINNKRTKKDRFNIKEKVYSLRYSLMLKGSFFHRRHQSMEGSHQNKHDLSTHISSGPKAVVDFFMNENYTEVPPSPASVCSSVHEHFWRSTDYSSPTSSSGIHPLEDCEIPPDFGEINSNLNELRRKLNQFEGSVPAGTVTEQDTELNIEDQAEAYVRDLLVASGLYHGTCNVSLSKWDPLGKPISNQVFEVVEESYKRTAKFDKTSQHDEQEIFNHKLLLDLLNEALPAILNPPANMSRYMKAISSVHYKPISGRNLLCHVWEIIKSLLHPSADGFYYNFDNLLARDLKSDCWSGLIDDDFNDMGRDVEGQIIRDLLEEMVTE